MGTATGPSPVDRGKPGSKMHMLTDRDGIPLAVAVSAANVHDSQALKPLVKPSRRCESRRGPRRIRLRHALTFVGVRPYTILATQPNHTIASFDCAMMRLWMRCRKCNVQDALLRGM